MTLVNGRAADGGAIRGRSRNPPGLELTGTEAMAHVEAARLAIMGGAIRDCEATNDGGAIALMGESGSMLGAGAVEVPPLPPGALALFSDMAGFGSLFRMMLRHARSTPFCPT